MRAVPAAALFVAPVEWRSEFSTHAPGAWFLGFRAMEGTGVIAAGDQGE
jgi:hypothetical protein